MEQHLSTLLPLIIEMLQDQSSTKRDIALRTLGQLAANLGYVIAPFFDYPQLLDILLGLIKTENNKMIRKEVIEVLGILGSLDPYKYKSIRVKTGQEATGKAQSEESRTPPSTNERYYPTVAINALVRIMKDPSLSVHYHNAIESLTPILKGLGTKCAAFLPQIMPPFLQIMRNAESATREFLFQELSSLVATAKFAIRDYLEGVSFEMLNYIGDSYMAYSYRYLN
jgi:FKBP12-rapamycin complex-associated protein